ncbi:MAG TPA: DUF222 domain-containing protein, partial [Streptosporangiaceae bacterium]
MCEGQSPSTVEEALAAVHAGLAYLNQVAAADLPGVVQAGCLRELARAESAYTAAHARMLGAFSASGGHEDDGQQTARAWLKWQTQVSIGAAAGAVGWMKRLAAHPAVDRALTAGTISPSWARHICTWTDALPEDGRDDADEILLAAAAGGATLPDLAGLAEEMRRRTAAPDLGGPEGPEGDGGFGERRVRLGLTFGGAGVLEGDLTPACAAALQAVLEALGKKAGPEDVRTAAQRRHDALEEACRRLTGAGCLPGRAGQPTHIQLHLTLDQLRGLPGAAGAEAAWTTAQAAQEAAEAARAAAEGQPGWLTGRAAQGYACDAAITPIVTGRVDQAALAALAAELLAALADDSARNGGPGHGQDGASSRDGETAWDGVTSRDGDRGRGGHRGPRAPVHPAALARLHEILLRHAAAILSGPGGLASFLRTRLTAGQCPSVSLPLDTGTPTHMITPCLRHAVLTRDRHCAFPGCHAPPAACQIHHIRPKAKGGKTTLTNLVLLCAFHHLIAVHQWGWTLTLNADGTTTATSP